VLRKSAQVQDQWRQSKWNQKDYGDRRKGFVKQMSYKAGVKGRGSDRWREWRRVWWLMRWCVQDEVNQDESEQDVVDEKEGLLSSQRKKLVLSKQRWQSDILTTSITWLLFNLHVEPAPHPAFGVDIERQADRYLATAYTALSVASRRAVNKNIYEEHNV